MKPRAISPLQQVVSSNQVADLSATKRANQTNVTPADGPGKLLSMPQMLDKLLLDRDRGGATDSASSCQGLMPPIVQRKWSHLRHVAFLNPQGNFDAHYSHLGAHPDFGGQLIYVLETAKALVKMGVKVDVITRRIEPKDGSTNLHNPEWAKQLTKLAVQGNQGELAGYVNILRFDSDPTNTSYLAKELLWDGHLERMSDAIQQYYQTTNTIPQGSVAHYGDGGKLGQLLQDKLNMPLLSFTGHSLGAQKQDKLKQAYLQEHQGELQTLGQIGLEQAAANHLGYYRFPQRLAAERLAMQMTRAIVVSTEQERDEQYTHPAYLTHIDPKGHDKQKFQVIPPGVNTSVFGRYAKDKSDSHTLASLLNCLKQDIAAERRHLPYAIFAARLDRKKNLQGLAEAFAQHNGSLAEQCNLLLLMKGGREVFTPAAMARLPQEEQTLLQEVQEKLAGAGLFAKQAVAVPGLANNQHQLNAIFRYMARKNQGFFVYPALYEPFGLMPLEAGLAGLAVAATNQGGPTESLADGCGILFDPNDASDIRVKLTQLAKQADTRRILGQRLEKRVLEKYSWDNTGEAYATLLNSKLAELAAASLSKKLFSPRYVD